MANLRLKGTTYHYRRRVPPALTQYFGRSEILLTLGTGSAREAAARARAVNVEIERVFRAVSTTSLAAEHVALILRRLRDEPAWHSPTRDELLAEYRAGDAATLGRVFELGPDAILKLPPEDQQRIIDHLERLLDGVAVVSADAVTTASRLEADVARRRAATAEATAAQAQQRADLAVRALVLRSSTPAAQAPAAPPAPLPSPKFSEREGEFLGWKRTKEGWTAQSVAQAEATFRLVRELLGDKALTSYTRQDAWALYNDLLRLPSSHGKGAAKGQAIPARDAIARADAAEAAGKMVPRVQLKTVKRHFSALLQYWKWLEPSGTISDLIWSGFPFPGTKSSKKKRDVWSPDDLKKLFASDWWTPDQPRDTARWWAPVISLHSGLRIEEICRLRPLDIETVSGVPCFQIRPHPDGWSPKTEAGERTVPVHPFLIDLGFLRLVEQRRKEKAARLFPELRPTGLDGKLSQALGRDFGRLKTRLGMGPKTVFHSFRHTIRDVLESTEFLDRWIDAVFGHENPERSEGARTYAKGVKVERLLEVVMAFKAPVDLSHLRGGGGVR